MFKTNIYFNTASNTKRKGNNVKYNMVYYHVRNIIKY